MAWAKRLHWMWFLPGLLLLTPLILGLQPRPQAGDPPADRNSLFERIRVGKGKDLPEFGYLFRENKKADRPYVPGEVLVRFKRDVPAAQVQALHRRLGTTVLLESRMVPGLQWVRLPVHLSVKRAIELFQQSGLVQYAEPNYIVHLLSLPYPNDPFVQIRDTATHPLTPGYFSQCDPESPDTDGKSWFTYSWDLQMATPCTYVDPFLCPSGFGCGGNNASRPDLGVLPCNDPLKCFPPLESQGAWTDVNQTTTQDVLVMVIDTGVDYTHVDVAANMWKNPGEVPGDGLDNDNNGIVDDVYGIRTIGAGGGGPGCGSANFGDPMDDYGHGTHVASTIAARANNFAGLIGMGGLNNRVKIVGCKFLDSSGSGTTADAIKCFEYAYYLKAVRGFNLVATSNSWGGGGFSWALYDAIAANRDAGILAVFAAGNAASDNDVFGNFPSNYDLDNIIAVGSMNQHDCASGFSNWGGRSVDIFAPGSLILGACPWPLIGMCSGDPNAQYVFASGTSMATPHVTGLAALLKAIQPGLQWWQIRNIILTTGSLSTQTDANCSALGGDDVDGGTFQSYTGDGTPAGKKSVTDRRINALQAAQVAAAGSGPGSYALKARIWPYGMGPFTVSQGHPFVMKVIHVDGWNVGAPGSVTAVINPGGCTVTFVDDGTPPDQVAGDGIFVGSFDFTTAPCNTPGPYTVDIQVNATSIETLTVHVTAPFTYVVTSGAPAPMTSSVCTTGTVILSSSDDGEANFTTTGSYPFAGVPYTQWRAGNNGALLPGVTTGDVPYTNGPLPSAAFNQALAIYWDDLYGPGSPTGTVVYEEVPAADPRNTTGEPLLVVAWCNQAHYNFGGPDRWTFQLAIGGTTGKIWYQYLDTSGQDPSVDSGASATVGVQMSPTSAVQYSFNSPSVPDGTVLLFTPTTAMVGVLEIVPAPLEFAFVPVGQSKSLPVHIRNVGTAPFDVTAVGPSPDPQFGVNCPPVPFTVNAGAEVLCQVTFTPAAGGFQAASIPVTTDTAGSGSINAQGTGVGPYPDIHMPTTTLDFGTVVWGHIQTQGLTVRNVGASNLIISAVDNSLAPSVTVTTTLPLTIAPLTTDLLNLSWNSSNGCIDSRVGIVSNDPDESNVQVRALGRTSIADVASGVDYYVQRLISNQITAGCGTEASVYGVDLNGDGDMTDLVYCPSASITRAQMAIFISRAVLGGDPPAVGSGPGGSWNCTDGLPNHFTDVPDGVFYCPHVHWMWANNITGGCTATTYCPGDPVLRAQMAIFLQRAFALQCR